MIKAVLAIVAVFVSMIFAPSDVEGAGTEFVLKFGTEGSSNGQFNFPSDVALDSSDNIYVADQSNNRVQIFDSSGNFLSTFGSQGTGDGQFDGAIGIALDSSGDIYVTDVNNHRIQIFDSTGNFLSTFGSQGTGDGQFDFPIGIALDSSNNIYVADANNDRVQKFSPFVAVVDTIQGIVFSDTNFNNSQDLGEPGISGLTITLVDGDGVLSTTTTDSIGTYSFSNVAPGSLLVQTSVPVLHLPAPGFFSFVRPTLESGGTVTANFALVSVTTEIQATVTGTVYNDLNDNNVLDSGEPGIAGVQVLVLDFLTLNQQFVTTDSNGVYTATGVLPDVVLVQVLLSGGVTDGFLPSTSTDTAEFLSLDLAETATVNFGVREVPTSDLMTITLTVYNDLNNNGIQDSGEAGIEGMQVFSFVLLTAEQQNLFTDSNGQVTFSGLTPDVVLVQALPTTPATGFTPGTTPPNGFTFFSATDPTNSDNVEVGVAPAASLSIDFAMVASP